MKKFYFAGPDVFLKDADKFFKGIREYCAMVKVHPLIPLDNEIKPTHPHGVAQAIYEGNLKMIFECDVVIANITPFRGVSLDAGTAFEIGMAKALGKKIVGYTHDARPYKERVPNPAPSHPTVEDFGLLENLMIACAVNGIWRSVHSAIDWGRKC